MKIFLILIFLFFSHSVIADVYYCVEEIRFEYKDNFASERQTKRFTIKLDIEKLSLKSDELLFISDFNFCQKSQFDIIGCNNSMGDTFYIQLDTLNFVYTESFAHLTNGAAGKTSYTLGKCELF